MTGEVLALAGSWTQFDVVPGHSTITGLNKDTTQGVGIVIATSAPASTVAWNAHWIVGQGGDWYQRIGPSEHAYVRAQSNDMTTAGSGFAFTET